MPHESDDPMVKAIRLRREREMQQQRSRAAGEETVAEVQRSVDRFVAAVRAADFVGVGEVGVGDTLVLGWAIAWGNQVFGRIVITPDARLVAVGTHSVREFEPASIQLDHGVPGSVVDGVYRPPSDPPVPRLWGGPRVQDLPVLIADALIAVGITSW